MANDGWVKLVKNITTFLPKDRKYTKVEAAVSYLVNQNNGKSISIRGYSRIWGWGHGTTERFIDLVQKRYASEPLNSNNIHTLDPQPGTKVVQKRDTNYKNKIKTKRKELIMPQWLDLNLWQEWKDHRNKIKAPMSEGAEKRCLNTLENLIKKGYSQEKIIGLAIEMGWRGLFEPKKDVKSTLPDTRPAYRYINEITKERGF